MRSAISSAFALAVVGAAPVVASAQKCGQPMEVLASTPRETIAKMVVDQMFDEIVLTETQQTKAIAIVKKAIDQAFQLDPKAPDYRQKLDAANQQRDADLMALLTTDADKAKLVACFKKMQRPRRGGGS